MVVEADTEALEGEARQQKLQQVAMPLLVVQAVIPSETFLANP